MAHRALDEPSSSPRDDSLELLKEHLTGPTPIQLQDNRRGEAHEARALLSSLSESARDNLKSVPSSGKHVDFTRVISMITVRVLVVKQELVSMTTSA